MWIPIQIELQSIDIKDLKRDLSTLMKLTFFFVIHFVSFNIGQEISTAAFILIQTLQYQSLFQAQFPMRSNNTSLFENLKPSCHFKLVIGYWDVYKLSD